MPTGSFRGGMQVNNTLYGAWAGEVYTVNQSGDTVLFSTVLGSTDSIFVARNNATSPVLAIIGNGGVAYALLTSSAQLTTYPDADVGSPSAVGGHLGYFMFGYGNGDIQPSDLNSTNLNTLNKARTESNPDGVVNIVSFNGQLYVLGEKTIEVWGDPVNSSGFPLTRIGFHITPGLKAPHAVAGWQPEFGNPFIWVGSDSTVRQLDGFGALKISPPQLDRLIASVVFPATELEASCYVAGGHAFWQINCVTGESATSWSWVYNCNNQKWHERKSQASTFSRLKRSIPAFDKWLVGDRNSSDLWEFDHTQPYEGGAPISAIMESGPVKDFPNRQRIMRADFDFTPGVGLANGTEPIETDPSVLLEVSQDGGKTWPYSWVRKLGRQGETQQRIYVLNAGLSGDEGGRWRWTVSDPVHLGFIGAAMDPEVVKK
jgi:hypothetical protein